MYIVPLFTFPFSFRCEVFRAMLSVPPGSDPSASLVLSDIRPNIFLAVLEFIYTNCCSLSTHMVRLVLGTGLTGFMCI